MDKSKSRHRRATKTRAKITLRNVARLSIHRTPRHIYAQVIDTEGKVLAAASTAEKAIQKEIKNGGNVAAATVVGKQVAERAVKVGVKSIAFDRSGFRYHGRVKALADAAREAGLEF